MTFTRRQYGLNHAYYDDGLKIPGVTTILSDAIHKPGLTVWAAREAAKYAVAQWDLLTDLSPADRELLIGNAANSERDAASQRGQEIHRIAQRLLRGEQVDKPDDLAGHIEACVNFLDDYAVAEVVSECAVINRAVPYAGTLDLVGDIQGQRWLLDWKTGKHVYPQVALQLAAYAHAEHYLLPGGKAELPVEALKIQRAGCVHLQGDGTYDLYPARIDSVVYALFQAMAASAAWTHWDKDNGAKLDTLLGPAEHAMVA